MICPACAGTGACTNCRGTGRETCPDCNGTGWVTETCPLCLGTGQYNGQVCPTCNGTTTIRAECPTCNGATTISCRDCSGSGRCRNCNGTGQIPGMFAARYTAPGVISRRTRRPPQNRARLSYLTGSAPLRLTDPPPPGRAPINPWDLVPPSFREGEALPRHLGDVVVGGIRIIDFWELVKQKIRMLTPGPNWALDELTPQVNYHMNTFDHDPFQMGPEYPVTALLPESFPNPGSTQDTFSFNYTASGQTTETWSVTRGYKFGGNVSFNIGKVLQAGGSINLDVSRTDGQSVTTGQSTSATLTLSIPPHSVETVEIVLYKRDISMEWWGNAAVVGTVKYSGHFGNTHFWSNGRPLGSLFAAYPEPGITVLDQQTVLCDIRGTYTGAQALRFEEKKDVKPIPQLFSYNLRSRYPWWSNELMEDQTEPISNPTPKT